MQKSLTSYGDRPQAIVTKQKFSESVRIIRDKDRGIPEWHYILVPFYNVVHFKGHPTCPTIDITRFGRVIEYRNNRGEIKSMAGSGTDPPKMIQTWVDEHYGKKKSLFLICLSGDLY